MATGRRVIDCELNAAVPLSIGLRTISSGPPRAPGVPVLPTRSTGAPRFTYNISGHAGGRIRKDKTFYSSATIRTAARARVILAGACAHAA